MNNKRRFLSIALVLVILLGSFNLGFAIDLDNLTEYNMELSLDTKSHNLKGKQETIFTNTYNKELKDLVFHLYADSYKSYETLPSIGGNFFPEGEIPKLPEESKGYINIEKVYINDEEVKYTDDNQILKINMDQPVKKGEQVNIKMDFTLKIPEGYHRFHHQDGIYSLTNWYPVLSIYNEKTNKWDENPYHPIGESNYSDVSDYNVKLTLPKNMLVAPTGSIVGEVDNGKDKTVEIRAEKVRDFVFITGEKYKIATKEVDGIKISSYYLEEDKNSQANQDIILDEVAKTVKFMNERVGKYPYDELRIVETNLGGGAMEYPQVLQMGRYWDMSEINIEEAVPFNVEAAVHEAMHQWWYVIVGNDEYNEPFLDESLTVFTTAYYFQEQYGKEHGNGIDYDIRMSLYPSDIKPIGGSVDDFTEWMDYSEAIYQRGPAFFEDLRQRIGEEKFIQVLRSYFEEYKFKNASIEGLLDVIENVAGKDTRKTMAKFITEPNYHPENIQLSEEEQRVFHRNRMVKQLKEAEKRYGLVMGSILLKGLEDGQLVVVNEEVGKTWEGPGPEEEIPVEIYDSNNILEEVFNLDYGIEVKNLQAKDLSEEDKKGNLILIGDPNLEGFLRDIGPDLDLNISSDIIKIDDLSIKNENLMGAFISKNPNNEESLILVIFNNKDQLSEEYDMNPAMYYIYEIIYNHDSQFTINTDKIEIKGRYK